MKLRDTLSATLLAHADAPRRWKTPLSPDPAKPYPLWLLAVRTLLWATFFTGLGWLWLHSHWTLVWWPFWMAVSVGVVWGGMTALAWNRRAARLRTATAAGQPPSDYERLAFWAKFTLVPIYYLIFFILTPLVLALSVANTVYRAEWSRYRAELISRGIELDIVRMASKTVPAEENLASTPLFKDLSFELDAPGRASRSVFFERMKTLRLPEVKLPNAPLWLNQQPLDLAKFRAAMTNAPVFPKFGEGMDDAAAVLKALTVWDTELRELTTATARPVSAFPVLFEDNFQAILPHLSVLKDFGAMVRLRASARLRRADAAGALQDLATSWRLARFSESEPLLISFLVGIGIDNQTRQVLWEGLRAKAWNESQLAELDGLLATRDYARLCRRAVDGERAISSSMMEQWIADPAKQLREANNLGQMSDGGPVGNAEVFGLLFRTLPIRFVISQNLIAMNRWYDEILPASGLPMDAAAMQTKMDRLVAGSSHPSEALVRMLFPALGIFVEKGTVAQTHQALSRTAIALERHALATGSYPNSLSELTPKFLPTALNDPFGKTPLHYTKTSDGRFLLYSVGPNGRDDQGRAVKKKEKDIARIAAMQNPKTPATATADDIAWTYLPLEK